MSNTILDQQFVNLIARARVSPYFDFERALCVAMESHMQRMSAISDVISPSFRRSGQGRGVTSVAKIFSWPSEELCACLHKSETDHLYIFDASKKDLSKIESREPILRSIDAGDRIVILNEWAGRYVDQNFLENLFFEYRDNTNEFLEQEIVMQVCVRARGKEQAGQKDFIASVLTA